MPHFKNILAVKIGLIKKHIPPHLWKTEAGIQHLPPLPLIWALLFKSINTWIQNIDLSSNYFTTLQTNVRNKKSYGENMENVLSSKLYNGVMDYVTI